MQTTLAAAITLSGVGLHSGRPASVRLAPAPAGSGIVFRRADRPGIVLPARWDRVEQVPLCTRLSGPEDVTLSTIEHLMAAAAGAGLGNLAVEVSGPEVPILDGSALPFVRAIDRAGLRRQAAPLRVLQILRRVTVAEGLARATLEPHEGAAMRFEIAFPDAAIGEQSLELDLAGRAFVDGLADARTFCRAGDVDQMHAAGLALGGSLRNAVVVDGAAVLSPGGLRRPDEPVRHKMLDALGDLALAGGPFLGRYIGVRAGHALTNRLLRRLFATPGAWRWIEGDEAIRSRLPGLPLPVDLAKVA